MVRRACRPGTIVLAAIAVASCLWAGPVRAEDAENPYLERWNRTIFGFNVAAARTWQDFSAEFGGLKATILPNVLSNFINEPLSVAAFAIAGDYRNAWDSTKRFVTNTTLGFGGMRDAAAEHGLPPSYIDMGLALCAHGVLPGPYIMLPITGPRTLRDGVMDVVVANIIIYGVVFSIIGTSAPISTIVVVEILDTFANMAIMRQIDAIKLVGPDVTYERIKAAYLESRSRRCDAVAAEHGATPPSLSR
jgi:ABC-type transporter lipoprotein component MlaA